MLMEKGGDIWKLATLSFAFSIRLFRMEISLGERVVDPHTREESEYGKSIKLLSMFVCKIDLFRIEYSCEVYVEGWIRNSIKN